MNDFEIDVREVEQTRRLLHAALDTAPSLADDGPVATLASGTTGVHPGVADAVSGFVADARTLLTSSSHELGDIHATLAQIVGSYQAADADAHTSITGVDRD